MSNIFFDIYNAGGYLFIVMPHTDPEKRREYVRLRARRVREQKQAAGECLICSQPLAGKWLCARHIRKKRRAEREWSERRKGAPLRAYNVWTDEAIADLILYRAQGYMAKDIAELLDRTIDAVRQKSRALNLPKPRRTMYQQRWAEAFKFSRTHEQAAARMETTVEHSRQMLAYLRHLGWKIKPILGRAKAKVKKKVGPRSVPRNPGLDPGHPWRKGWKEGAV